MLKIISEVDISVLLPMTDLTVPVVLEYKRKFENLGIKVPFASKEKVDLLSDKSNLCEIARDIDIPFPGTRYIGASEACEISETIKYPVVLKPFRSKIEDGLEVHFGKVKIVHSADELRSVVCKNPVFEKFKFLLQEYIKGEGQGFFALYNKGEMIASFSHKRIREKPPWGGVSVLSESQKTPDSISRIGKKLLDHAGWHGVAMVEFKVSEDGTPFLMEVNARFWGSLQLAIDSGVNFPVILCNEELPEPRKMEEPPFKSVRLRWLLGDLDRLFIVMKSERYKIKEKLKNIFEFLFTIGRSEIYRFDDMNPFFLELKNYAAHIFKKSR